jgi:hypothetical protein
VSGPSEAERSLSEVVDRARLAIGLVALAGAVLARQIGLLPAEWTARAVVGGAALCVPIAVRELTLRVRGREVAAQLAALGDACATAVAVGLLAPAFSLAPALFLWPLLTASLALPAAAAVALAVADAGAIALGLRLGGVDLVSAAAQAGGWGIVLVGGAAAQGEVLRRFRRAQRTSESAFASAAELVEALSEGEVAEKLFTALCTFLGANGESAALYTDGTGERDLLRVASTGGRAWPERLAREDAAVPAGLSRSQPVWLESARLPEGLRDAIGPLPATLALSLRDRGSTVGLVVVAAARATPLAGETVRAVERIAAHTVEALRRIRLTRLVERTRGTMTALLDCGDVAREPTAIAAWAAQAASSIASGAAAVVERTDASQQRLLATSGQGAAMLASLGAAIADAALVRQLPVVVADAVAQTRFSLGRGPWESLAAVPVRPGSVAILVGNRNRESLGSGEMQLLVMLAGQTGLLLEAAASERYGHAALRPRGELSAEAWPRQAGRR